MILDLYDLVVKNRLYESTLKHFINLEEDRPQGKMSDEEFVKFITKEFLGKDWHCLAELDKEQINYRAFWEIIIKYSPKLKDKKEEKKHD